MRCRLILEPQAKGHRSPSASAFPNAGRHFGSSACSSHSSICLVAIVRFGRCGLSVPAATFGVSTSFALAKFLASRSLGNVSVALARECFLRGTSNETYHVPWNLLAMGPSRGLCRRLTAVRLQPAFSWWWGHRRYPLFFPIIASTLYGPPPDVAR